MGFSFDSTLARARDEVRLKLGDTTDKGHVLEDESIDALLARYSFLEACAQAAEAASAAFARKAEDTKEGDEARSYRGRAKHFLALAAQFRQQDAAPPPAPQLAGSASGCLDAPDLTDYRT